MKIHFVVFIRIASEVGDHSTGRQMIKINTPSAAKKKKKKKRTKEKTRKKEKRKEEKKCLLI